MKHKHEHLDRLLKTNESVIPTNLEAAFCGHLKKDGSKRRKTIGLRRFCV